MLKLLSALIISGIMVSWPIVCCAQDSTKIPRQKNLSTQADDVEVLLKKGAEPKTIAEKYEEIGRTFKLNGQNEKAIQYFQKAADYYKKAKSKDDASRLLREIAQMRERKEELKEAVELYEQASSLSNSVLNKNDAVRASVPDAESKIIINQQNLNALPPEMSNDLEVQEKAINLSNQAKLYDEIGKKENALTYSIAALNVLESKGTMAMGNSKEITKMKIEVNAQIAELYLKNQQFDDALMALKRARELALESGDLALIVQSSADLAEIYKSNNDREKALFILKDAYRLALNSGRTLDARKALLSLVKYYHEGQDIDSQLFFYADFIEQLETLIARDSSMLDEKIFFAKEERIEQLEKERALQDELLSQSRNFNFGLIVFFVALTIVSIFLLWSFMKVRMQNKKIALQSLRREMNPHFIFNSLNSVNRFIAQNDEIKANNYLTSYAQLMRTTMEISAQDFIRLDKEIELLTKYLDLEHLRFGQHFDYRIELDDSIELENCSVPGFLIQPHLENAIWHGLRYKKEKGLLTLKISELKGSILVTIEDNGIGINQSQKLKTENQKSHQSRGFSNIKERIELLNSLYSFKIEMTIISPMDDNIGTSVRLVLPKIVKNG